MHQISVDIPIKLLTGNVIKKLTSLVYTHNFPHMPVCNILGFHFIIQDMRLHMWLAIEGQTCLCESRLSLCFHSKTPVRFLIVYFLLRHPGPMVFDPKAPFGVKQCLRLIPFWIFPPFPVCHTKNGVGGARISTVWSLRIALMAMWFVLLVTSENFQLFSD